MTVRTHIANYLKQGSLLQLATCSDGKPWACSVYYVVDGQLRLYWLSYPERRHSQDIAANGRAAITVAVKQDMPVVGIQAEGTVTIIKDVATAARILPRYIKKYGAGRRFLANLKLGKNRHALYCFTPERIVLFDEENYGHDIVKEIIL